MFAATGTDPFVRAITLAYPVGDLAILCCLLISLVRESDRHVATVPLPAGRGDFGSGVVETLGPDDVGIRIGPGTTAAAFTVPTPEDFSEVLQELVSLRTPGARR